MNPIQTAPKAPPRGSVASGSELDLAADRLVRVAKKELAKMRRRRG